MTQPLVSVILPVRNGARFIGEALASVVAQEVEHVETIVIDAESSDGTRDIVVAFGPQGVQLVDQAGSGIAAAWNQGIELARAEFVAFMSSDDRWLPGKLTRQLTAMRAEPDVMYSVTNFRYFLEPGCNIPVTFNRALLGKPLVGRIMETLLVRRGIFKLVGMFNTEFRTAEDVDWYARAQEAGVRMCVLDDVLLKKRIHDANLSTSAAENTPQTHGRAAAFNSSAPRPDRMTTPTVSVVIAVWNGERFVRDAIRSVLSQEIPELELIVVDDGSTDDTAAAVQSFAGVRYAYQANAGQPAALNHGVRLARGELLGFNDADDVWMPGRLRAQLDALRATPSLDVVFGHVEQFSEPDAPRGVAAQAVARGVQASRLHTSMLIRRRAFDRVGAFREDMRIGSVVDWAHRARHSALQEQLLELVVLRRRLHADNIGLVQEHSASRAYLAVVKAALNRRRGKNG